MPARVLRRAQTRGRGQDLPSPAAVSPAAPAPVPATARVRALVPAVPVLVAAAAQLLARANTAEPGSRSVLEALARAQFDAHRYGDAADSFRQIVDASPTDDYAQFGLGLALARTGNPRGAAEHLALAVAMRPDLRHYTDALRGVRATLRARREAGLPDQISPGERGRATDSGPGPA